MLTNSRVVLHHIVAKLSGSETIKFVLSGRGYVEILFLEDIIIMFRVHDWGQLRGGLVGGRVN